MSQPKISFKLHGTGILQINCGQIVSWIEKLKKAKVREFWDESRYIKLYSRFNILILIDYEKESLMFQMAGKKDEAQGLADEFFYAITKS